MATLKNKRLTERDRIALFAFAKKQIEATEDRAAMDSAYEYAAEAVSEAVKKDNPPSDMKVLIKYDLAHLDRCINISTGGMDFDQFHFRDDDKRTPMRPYSRRGCGYGQRSPILLEGDAADRFRAYLAATKVYEASIKARGNDFKSLILGTTTFNALAEVWPAVEAMREKVVGTSTALAALSAEVVNRIKADPALAVLDEAA
jgi:hypothetical protein